MSTPLIRLEDVSVSRAGRLILDRLSLDVHAGQSLVVQGPSGSGKSTLLAVLAGLEHTDSGTIQRTLRGDEIGLVLQGHGLASLLTAAENIALPLQAPARPRIDRTGLRRRTEHALDQVGLGRYGAHLVEALSIGQQQRVAIARSLITHPALLIADEPTAALDTENRQHIADILFALPRQDTALVLASHDPALAARADQVISIGR